MVRSGKKEMFGSSVRRHNGGSDGRHHRAQLYRPVARDVAGPTGLPVGAEEIVVSGATAAPHVSRPRQAFLGPRHIASIHGLRRAHRGPGGYCRHSGNRGTTGRPAKGPQHSSENFTKDQALQAWRTSPRVFPSARDLSSRGHHGCHLGFCQGPSRKARRGLPASRGFLPLEASSVSATERTWALRPPQSHGRTKAR